jgi:hypothetical protein
MTVMLVMVAAFAIIGGGSVAAGALHRRQSRAKARTFQIEEERAPYMDAAKREIDAMLDPFAGQPPAPVFIEPGDIVRLPASDHPPEIVGPGLLRVIARDYRPHALHGIAEARCDEINRWWLAKCECGEILVVTAESLMRGLV